VALKTPSARTRPGKWRLIYARTPGRFMPGVPRIQYPKGEEARPCRRVFSSRRPPVALAMASNEADHGSNPCPRTMIPAFSD
jgi:hypothetical protein